MTTSYSLSKPLTSTPVPWWWNDAIAASRSFMLKPAFPSLACAPSDATISSRSSIGHSGKNDGRRSAPLDALQLPSNRPCASSQKRRSFGPASEAGGKKSAKSSSDVSLRKIPVSYRAPPCQNTFAQTVNRTKTFHVKHFCPIEG